MKAPTKAELKDRIAELEVSLAYSRESSGYWHGKCRKVEQEAQRATIAAYACLAVIFILVVWEIIL